MLHYEEIKKSNLELAARTLNQIFKEQCSYNSAYIQYEAIIKAGLDYIKYYLAYNDNELVGVTGMYTVGPIENTDSLWLGWFGVLEEHRRKGYGKQILLDTMEKVKVLAEKYQIKYFRLYTSERDNDLAQHMYEEIMDIKEYYNNPDDINYDNTCVIYTKSMINEEPQLWNNKFMNLKGIEGLG